MRETRISLNMLKAHGKVKTHFNGETVDFWTENSITSIAFNLKGDCYKRHLVSLPGKYCIPFRIDMNLRLDHPALIFLIGGGHITFSSADNHKIEDIVKPSGKPNQDIRLFDNELPFGEFVDISITYSFGEMQILIGGEERFYSCELPYMRAKNLREMNADGFRIGLAVSKLSTLSIKSISVTEFDGRAPVVHNRVKEAPREFIKNEDFIPSFESVISELPREYRNELIQTDGFLTALKPLKFKRMVDKKSGKLTYLASDFGVSYIMQVCDNRLFHNFGWYIVTGGKPQTWHRKADYMNQTLIEIAKTDTGLADRVFFALNDCVNCYGSRCLAKTLYEFNGQKRLTCHGRVMLRMCHEDLQDAREFFRVLNALLEQKIADKSLQTEKIMLVNEKNSLYI